jgi:hypothetical protein
MTTRWEYGGEFHWPEFDQRPGAPIVPEGTRLFASGRDALCGLFELGTRLHGWRRLHLPGYFCQKVAASVESAGLELVLYPDSPLQADPVLPRGPMQADDVVLVVNYFGLRRPPKAESLAVGPATLIEDHTHDPWSRWATTSGADYCMASLRKTLPIADGAALWSPRGRPLPEWRPVTPEREAASRKKLAAMRLKRLYLEGEDVEKPAFRRLQQDGEEQVAGGEVSGPSPWSAQMLHLLPWEAWRTRREANYRCLAEALSGLPGIRVLRPDGDAGFAPYMVFLECNSAALRDQLRTELLAANVYASVIWPIPARGGPLKQKAAKLSRRILTIPCDYRYREDDLHRVAEVAKNALFALRACA